MRDHSVGSLEREAYSLELCGKWECPGEDDELFAECFCDNCALPDRACDGLTADDWVLDVRGFNATGSEDNEFDASEIISAAVGLVPPLEHFVTVKRYGASRVVFPPADESDATEAVYHLRAQDVPGRFRV